MGGVLTRCLCGSEQEQRPAGAGPAAAGEAAADDAGPAEHAAAAQHVAAAGQTSASRGLPSALGRAGRVSVQYAALRSRQRDGSSAVDTGSSGKLVSAHSPEESTISSSCSHP